MTLLAQLRAMVDPLPTGASVSIPADWLRARLAEERSDQSDQPLAHDAIVGLTVQELAEEIGRGASTIRTWISEGCFPHAYRLRNREWRIPRDDIRAYVRKQAGEAPPTRMKANSVRRRRREWDLAEWRQHTTSTS